MRASNAIVMEISVIVLKTYTRLCLLGIGMLCPGILWAELELELRPPVGQNILSWSPEQQLQGYGNMDSIFPTRIVPSSDTVLPLPSVEMNYILNILKDT